MYCPPPPFLQQLYFDWLVPYTHTIVPAPLVQIYITSGPTIIALKHVQNH